MRVLTLIGICLLGLSACENKAKELSENEKMKRDSISVSRQRHRSDSIRRTNPLMPIPPDSNYTGDYIDRYPNGLVKFRGQYRFGERHGQWLSFYEDGDMWSEMHYDKGQRHGTNRTFYENGKLRYEGRYKFDKLDSVWVYYDSLGVLKDKVLYKDDRVVEHLPLNK